MVCPNCRSEINDASVICPRCNMQIRQTNYPQENLRNTQQNPSYSYNGPMVDPGESFASTTFICGILSLFLGAIPAIIAIVFANKYKQTGNGNNASKVKTGKTIAIVSIVLQIVSVIAYFAIVFLMVIGSGAAYTPDYLV